jgi:hypothetical protein
LLLGGHGHGSGQWECRRRRLWRVATTIDEGEREEWR